MKKGKQEMDERIRGFSGYGLIQILHGYGKGKTTAALGQAIRCVGSGRNVAIIYFDKGGDSHYSERSILDKIEGIEYHVTGRDRIDPKTGGFDFSINDVDKSEAKRGMKIAKNLSEMTEIDLLILDEINSTVDLEMLNLEELLAFLLNKRDNLEVILTGRNPHKKILEAAHLITNVGLERHYFYSGVSSREGLDF